MNSEQQTIEFAATSATRDEEKFGPESEQADTVSPIFSRSPSQDLNLAPILDVNLKWLGKLQIRDRVPALQGILDIYKDSPIKKALFTHLAYIDDAPSTIFPEIKDPKECRRRFFETYLPERIRKDRRRISEYRIAGDAAVMYAAQITAAGIDLFQDEIVTKLIDLPKAVKLYKGDPEVFKNFGSMKSAKNFNAYARGLIAAKSATLSPFERYLNAYSE
jgi:hypothetical protein